LTLDSAYLQDWNVSLSKRVALALLAPPTGFALLAAQGMRVRRTALRLPEAACPEKEYSGAAGQPLNLYVVGDSVAAAVGLSDHAVSIAGRLAELLAADRPVRRTVLARSGFDAAETTRHIAGRLADADLVVISVGVNDTKDLHSTRRWRRDLTWLLDSVTGQAPGARVVLLAIPPMEKFPALPRALGLALGARSRAMDRIGRDVAGRYPAVRRLELPRSDFALVEDPFARDGFHPSEALHAAFATRIHTLLEEPS